MSTPDVMMAARFRILLQTLRFREPLQPSLPIRHGQHSTPQNCRSWYSRRSGCVCVAGAGERGQEKERDARIRRLRGWIYIYIAPYRHTTPFSVIVRGRYGPRTDVLSVFCALAREVEERGEATRSARTARGILCVLVWVDSNKSDEVDG